MEDRIKGIVGNPYLDWRYSERPDVPPTAAPAASTTPVIAGVAQEEKSDNVQLPPDVGTENDENVCMYVCMSLLAVFAIYSKNLQATHTSKFVIICNIFLRMPL